MEAIRKDPGNGHAGVNGDHDVCDGAEDGRLEDTEEEETHGDLGERHDGLVDESEGIE